MQLPSGESCSGLGKPSEGEAYSFGIVHHGATHIELFPFPNDGIYQHLHAIFDLSL